MDKERAAFQAYSMTTTNRTANYNKLVAAEKEYQKYKNLYLSEYNRLSRTYAAPTAKPAPVAPKPSVVTKREFTTAEMNYINHHLVATGNTLATADRVAQLLAKPEESEAWANKVDEELALWEKLVKKGYAYRPYLDVPPIFAPAHKHFLKAHAAMQKEYAAIVEFLDAEEFDESLLEEADKQRAEAEKYTKLFNSEIDKLRKVYSYPERIPQS